MKFGLFGAASCAVLFALIACSSDDEGDGQTGDPVSTAGSGGAGAGGAATGGRTATGGAGGTTGGTSGVGGACPPCAAPPSPACVGQGPCGCGPYVCPDAGGGSGEPCGDAICPVGTECCNPLMGICVMPGMVCIQ